MFKKLCRLRVVFASILTDERDADQIDGAAIIHKFSIQKISLLRHIHLLFLSVSFSMSLRCVANCSRLSDVVGQEPESSITSIQSIPKGPTRIFLIMTSLH